MLSSSLAFKHRHGIPKWEWGNWIDFMVDVTSYKLPASNIWQFMSFHYAVSVSIQTKERENSWFLLISHMQCMPTQHDNTSFIFLIYSKKNRNTHNDVTAISTIQKKMHFAQFPHRCRNQKADSQCNRLQSWSPLKKKTLDPPHLSGWIVVKCWRIST